jgi:hypothetical protein
MKKNTWFQTTSFLLAVLLFAPLASYAQIEVSAGGDTTSSVGGGADGVLEVHSYTDIDASAEVDAEAKGTTSTKAEEEEGSTSSTTALLLKLNALGVAVNSSSEVVTDADLEVFSANVSAENENVAGVSVTKNGEKSEVMVEYKHRARLFGFIPVKITSTTFVKAKANGEAEVRTRLPWWRILVTSEDYTKAEIESRIKNNATIKANAKVDASASEKAQIAEAIIAELDAEAKANAEAEAQASDR